MKKKITKILGVVLTLALLSSLAMVAAPVAAAPGTNAWGVVTLPTVSPGTDVELIAVAADGTLFASVYDGAWTIWKSAPNADGIAGFTWTKTAFKDHTDQVRAISCAPNWGSNDTVYVGTDDGEVFRCTGAGDDTPVLLRAIVGNDPDNPEDIMEAETVYDMDLWSDGNSIWIMVATDIDILVMEDALFAEWIDMDLSISFDGTHDSIDGTPMDEFDRAYVCRFAPDFDQHSLIWAILEDDNDGDAWISTTISPGQWGQVINSVEIENDASVRSSIDLAFSDIYDSVSAPILFAALNALGSEGDDLYLIEGGFGIDSTIATPLEVDGGGIDFCSIEVSGEVIMGGAYRDNEIWISRNGGDTFDLAVKQPTGTRWTQVLMAPGAFDPSEGIAYVATRGRESAFSYTNDGGDTWNQTAFVDTEIDLVLDVTFAPATASQPAALLTDNTGDGDLSWPFAESVWRTDDITATTPQWERVYCTQISTDWDDDFKLVEYALDGSSVMLFGDFDGDSKILKSTDNLQTWTTWRTLPGTMGEINDWVVTDSATVFAACDNGFFGTSRFGPAKQRLLGELNSIAVFGDTVAVGFTNGGEVAVSLDAGNVWGTPVDLGEGSTVFVAFGPTGTLYAATSSSEVLTVSVTGNVVSAAGTKPLKDGQIPAGTAEATGFSGIWVSPDNAVYAIGGDVDYTPATNEWRIQGTVDIYHPQWGTDPYADDVAIDALLTILTGTFTPSESVTIDDDNVFGTGWTSVAGEIYLYGATGNGTIDIDLSLLVLDNNSYPFEEGDSISFTDVSLTAEYVEVSASSTVTSADLFRLLIGEDDNLWETANRDGAMGLWGTTGSNFLWTIVDGNKLYALKDTLSGPVTGVAVSAIGENSATVSWSAMVGTSLTYEYKYDSAGGITASTSKTLMGLTDNKPYTVKVRVATQLDDPFPWSSRWSIGVTFTTVEAIVMPDNLVPDDGLQNTPLLPSFVWGTVDNAIKYEFQLSTDPAYSADGFILITAVIEEAEITAPTTAYTSTIELAYDTNHYWIVRAISATGTKSVWCFSNFHTMMEAIPPVTIVPPPTPTIILPVPTVIVPDITLPDITVEPPDVIVDVNLPTPTITTVSPVIEMPEEATPIYIWIIVGIGALLTIAVIVLIIRTRRVV